MVWHMASVSKKDSENVWFNIDYTTRSFIFHNLRRKNCFLSCHLHCDIGKHYKIQVEFQCVCWQRKSLCSQCKRLTGVHCLENMMATRDKEWWVLLVSSCNQNCSKNDVRCNPCLQISQIIASGWCCCSRRCAHLHNMPGESVNGKLLE